MCLCVHIGGWGSNVDSTMNNFRRLPKSTATEVLGNATISIGCGISAQGKKIIECCHNRGCNKQIHSLPPFVDLCFGASR